MRRAGVRVIDWEPMKEEERDAAEGRSGFEESTYDKEDRKQHEQKII